MGNGRTIRWFILRGWESLPSLVKGVGLVMLYPAPERLLEFLRKEEIIFAIPKATKFITYYIHPDCIQKATRLLAVSGEEILLREERVSFFEKMGYPRLLKVLREAGFKGRDISDEILSFLSKNGVMVITVLTGKKRQRRNYFVRPAQRGLVISLSFELFNPAKKEGIGEEKSLERRSPPWFTHRGWITLWPLMREVGFRPPPRIPEDVIALLREGGVDIVVLHYACYNRYFLLPEQRELSLRLLSEYPRS